MNNHTEINSSLIRYEEEGEIIYQRIEDGYINATSMCNAVGKEWFGYFRLGSTKDFITALSSSLKIKEAELIVVKQGGTPYMQGTWVHPQIAMHLAQWLSPQFAVRVSKWVLDWLSGKRPQYTMPYHLKRYLLNSHKVPQGYFSILQEMNIVLVAPLEQRGYLIPGHIVPDISEGRLFAGLLKGKGVNTDDLPCYEHRYEDGRVVLAKLYPLKYLEDFRDHITKVWLPTKAKEYFEARDIRALPYVEQVLQFNLESEEMIKKNLALRDYQRLRYRQTKSVKGFPRTYKSAVRAESA
jgi:hypothetical protein